MPESCSNDSIVDADASIGEGKRKVNCKGEAFDDDSGVNDDRVVGINEVNDANGGDSMIKVAATDMKYFASRKLSRSLAQKEKFSLI